MHRIFVAIPMSLELQNKVLQLQKSFGNLPVRWTQPKNLHITLVPPWKTERLHEEAKKLETIQLKQFDIYFNTLEFGPNNRTPKMIWVSGPIPHEIVDLRQKNFKALKQQPEPRPFKLHMTLARFQPENFLNFPFTQLPLTINLREHVNSFALMESHLSPRGSNYKMVKNFTLK
jgi:2'-5' RNA ligase